MSEVAAAAARQLQEIARRILADGTVSAADRTLLAQAADPPVPAPANLVPADAGQPSFGHREALLRLSARKTGEDDSVRRARMRYHARMLGHAAAPQAPEFRPLVTILIPVFNRADLLAEAVESCLAQTWRPIEILVIDDGSTDDPAGALARYGDQVRLLRKPKGGVASARNLGVDQARGDFIHFLDSDDLLLPTAIEQKVAAFAAVGDADLCYGQSQWLDMRVSPPAARPARLRNLDDPIRSMIVAFAFPVPAVMLARWRMLALPRFEEDLRRSSDFRYWQQLGFAGVKAIGVTTPTATLRRFPQSLHLTPVEADDSHAVALLRGLADLARHPSAWPYGFEYLNILVEGRVHHWLGAKRSPRVDRAVAELSDAWHGGAVMFDGAPLSPLPLLASLRDGVERLRRRGQWPDQDPDGAYRQLRGALDAAIAVAPSLSGRDIEFWAATPSRDTAMAAFCDALLRHAGADRGAAIAGVVLRGATRLPKPKAARRIAHLAARLCPLLGARWSARLAIGWAMRRSR